MPYDFELDQLLAGFVLNTTAKGGTVDVIQRELVGPTDALHLVDRLEKLQGSLFSHIPGLPPPSMIDHLLIILYKDHSGTAYVNELAVKAELRVSRDVEAGNPIFVRDITEIASVDLGVEVPIDAGVIVVRSFGWKRSLFYDLSPLHAENGPRDYSLPQVLAQQALLLLGLLLPHQADAALHTRLSQMANGLACLRKLLYEKCKRESEYQILLERHPWMLGGHYASVERHTALDNESIPDFTAVRCYDGFRDIIELKHPFIQCFRNSGGFSAAFNDAWNQAERYITFVHRQRSYLREEKGLHFENARCLLLVGFDLTESQLQEVRAKESLSPAIGVFTYNHLLNTAEHLLTLMETAGDRVAFGR